MISEIDVLNLKGNETIIDIRESYELEFSTYPGAIHIPMQELIDNYEKYLKVDEVYYILCKSGVRSHAVVDYLLDQGYYVINLVGGISRYLENE